MFHMISLLLHHCQRSKRQHKAEEEFLVSLPRPKLQVYPAFPLSTKATHTLQRVVKDGFGEVVVACNMPQPCKFPSLDSNQKRFL